MKKYLLSIPFFAVLGRSASVFIPYIIALLYGAGVQTDAFFLAFGLITFLTVTFTYVFESVLVPYLAEQKIGYGSATDFANGILACILPVLTFICFAIWFVIRFVMVDWRAGGGTDYFLMSQLFLDMIPFLLFGVWSSQANGIFYIHKFFLFPALSPLLRSAVVLIFLFALKPFWGVRALSLGFVFGEVLRWGVGIYLLKKMGWRLGIEWGNVAKQIRNFFRQMGFQLLALPAVNIIFFLDLLFASRLGAGNASLFNYADRIQQIPYLMFQAGFLHIFHSFWSDSYYQDARPLFWSKIKRHTASIFAYSFFLSFLLWGGRHSLIQIIFSFGGFSQDQLLSLGNLFGLLILSLAPAIIYNSYVRVLFVLKKSAVYCSLAWLQLLVKIALNLLLMKIFGLRGIALSTLCVTIAGSIGLHLYLRQYWRRDEDPLRASL